jgi:glycosyltransferase involved in cell wall biosynthesis
MGEFKTVLSASINENEVVLDRGGTFSLNLPADKVASNVFLVLDIYDLDRPVHPEGHIGWWRYDIGKLPLNPTGELSRDEGGNVRPVIDGAPAVDEWRNQTKIDALRMELLIVLRSAITNAILSVDRVPVVQSDQDLLTFRSGFDRNYQSPRYGPQHYIVPANRRVHIVSRNIFQRDAVGNLCLGLYRMLRQNRVAAHLFGENFDLAMNDIVSRRETLASRVNPDDIVFYFFSIYDGGLDELADMNCSIKIAYFHGVTPPNLLQVFHPELSAQCAKAIRQIPLLAKFDRLATNSRASADVLRGIFKESNDHTLPEEIRIVPPKLVGRDEPRSTYSTRVKAKPTRLLYVGRIISHKRIEDILHLLSEYRKFEPSAQCTIAGVSDSFAYRDYLRWVQIEQLNLPGDAVAWPGSVSEGKLDEVYNESTVYVSMSEHEGFCLPILEAMMRNVLVFAYDQPAIRETAGLAGVIFGNKSFGDLARQLYDLISSQEVYEQILETQRRRADEIIDKMDGRRFFELLATPARPGV